jgi:hypothetical protein
MEAFHTYLLGQVVSFALLKRGLEPLHSTAMLIDGVAVGFVGNCGYGKSTLAAACLRAGHPLLTDDLLMVKEEGHGFSAYPGPPRIKLFPEIATRLLGGQINGTPMNNLTPKLIIQLGADLSFRTATPLKVIYVIRPPATGSHSNRVAIKRLSQRKAFRELLASTYNTVITEPERLKRQFVFATQVASKVPVKSLSYPRSVDLLASVREAILQDLSR